jgi:CubicO group peptidase (beta-lactamase class C family)
MTADLNNYLRTYLTSTLDYFKVPGAFLSIVKGGETVFEPVGTTRADGEVLVNNETLFPALGCSRGYTAAAVALLIDAGQLGWDDPVVRHLPEFVLSDPWVTDNLTLRDLLSQRLELSPPDCTQVGDLKDQTQIVGFRERYAPFPLAFAVLAEIVTRVSGEPFADFMRQELFDPLGFTRTIVSEDWPGDDADNRVMPHTTDGDTARPIDPPAWNVPAADRGIFTCGVDCATWMRLNLRRGFLNRTPIVKWPSMVEIHAPHSIAEADERRGEVMAGHGLGWRVTTYSDHRISINEDHALGASAVHLLMPKENLGIAVHLNLECPPAARGIAFRLLDAFLGRPVVDWAPKFKTWGQEDQDTADANSVF